MSDYGMFEAASTDGLEEQARQREAERSFDRAVFAAQEQFGQFLSSATSGRDFDDRLALCREELRQVIEAHGIMPVHGIVRRVAKTMRPDFSKKADRKQANSTLIENFIAWAEQSGVDPGDPGSVDQYRQTRPDLPDYVWFDFDRSLAEYFGDQDALDAFRPDAEQPNDSRPGFHNSARRKQAKGPWKDVPTMLEPVPVADWSQYDDLPPEHWNHLNYGREDCPACKAEGTTTAATNDGGKELVNEGDWEGYLDEVSPQSEPAADKNMAKAKRKEATNGWNELFEYANGQQGVVDETQARTFADWAIDSGQWVDGYGHPEMEGLLAEFLEERGHFANKKAIRDDTEWESYEGDDPDGSWAEMDEYLTRMQTDPEQGREQREWERQQFDTYNQNVYDEFRDVPVRANKKTADHWKFDTQFQQFLLDVFGTTHGLTDDEIIEAMEQYAGIGPQVTQEPVQEPAAPAPDIANIAAGRRGRSEMRNATHKQAKSFEQFLDDMYGYHTGLTDEEIAEARADYEDMQAEEKEREDGTWEPLRGQARRKRASEVPEGKYFDPITEELYDDDAGLNDRSLPPGHLYDEITQQVYKDDLPESERSARRHTAADFSSWTDQQLDDFMGSIERAIGTDGVPEQGTEAWDLVQQLAAEMESRGLIVRASTRTAEGDCPTCHHPKSEHDDIGCQHDFDPSDEDQPTCWCPETFAESKAGSKRR